MIGPTLSWNERLHYRDRLRASRYSALADSEGFGEICFAVEALGLRLLGKESTMHGYFEKIKPLIFDSIVLTTLTEQYPELFTTFDALYAGLKAARNDAMHTGVYARHATSAAIELCIGLEEALMAEQQLPRETVADFMVKAPMIVMPWQPVAHARQLMLTHSFSYLPVFLQSWKLVPEISMAKYLRHESRKRRMACSIEDAVNDGLELIDAIMVEATAKVENLLNANNNINVPMLWLVQDRNGDLCGVLSPFELM
jgi:hypothetical protein